MYKFFFFFYDLDTCLLKGNCGESEGAQPTTLKRTQIESSGMGGAVKSTQGYVVRNFF